MEPMHSKIYKVRANFIKWLSTNGMFNTLGLMCSVNISAWKKEEAKAPAAVCFKKNVIQIYLSEGILDLPVDALHVVLMHEIRHVYQLTDFSVGPDLLDWSPMGTVDKSSKHFKQMAHQVCNIAMDIALNQDVLDLITNYGINWKASGDDFERGRAQNIKEIRKLLRGSSGIDSEGNELSGLMMVDNLQKVIDEKNLDYTVLSKQDWIYYGNVYIKVLARELKKQMEMGEAMGQAMQNALEEMQGGTGEGHDQHEFDELSQAEIDAMSQAAKEAVAKGQAEAARMSHAAGRESSDSTEQISGKYKVAKAIKQFLDAMKLKATVLSTKKQEVRKTYSRRNRRLPGYKLIPGHKRVISPTPAVVVVLDTSGSMYCTEFFQAMLGTLQNLEKKGKLAKSYCCDTELSPLDTSNINSVKMRGGGGTVFGAGQVDQILDDVGSGKVDILYLTDEEVWGLVDAKAHEGCNLHILNLPEMLKV